MSEAVVALPPLACRLPHHACDRSKGVCCEQALFYERIEHSLVCSPACAGVDESMVVVLQPLWRLLNVGEAEHNHHDGGGRRRCKSPSRCSQRLHHPYSRRISDNIVVVVLV